MVLGGLSIWYAKSAFENQWYAAITAGFVVLALMFYYIFNSTDDREEEGDNIYYLGLLFTLLSLIFALVEVFGTGTVIDSTAEQVRTLLANFGIALISTVVGILGRIIVQNYQSTPPGWIPFRGSGDETSEGSSAVVSLRDAVAATKEAAIRFQIDQTARDLRQGSAALARFHRIVRSYATETEENLLAHKENLKRESIEFKAALETDAKKFITEFEDLGKGILDSLKDRHLELLSKAEAFQKLSEETEKRIVEDSKSRMDALLSMLSRSSSESIESIKTNSTLLGNQLRATSEDLSQVLSRTSRELSGLGRSLEATNQAGLTLGNVLEEASHKAEKAGTELELFRQEIAQARNGVNVMLSSLNSVQDLDEKIRTNSELVTSARAITDMGESLNEIVREAENAGQRAKDATEIFSAFKENVEATRKESEVTLETLQALSAATAQQLEDLNRQKSGHVRWWHGWRR